MRVDKDFPLLIETPDSWTGPATADILALLNDHAHLEKKAATNALDLFGSWPGKDPTESWVKILGAIASDEVAHLNLVLKLINERGGQMSKAHRSKYAADLRVLVRRGQGPREILDRLLISAIIEARSAERFFLLTKADNLEPKLKKIYKALYASERGHFTVFKELASELVPTKTVNERWRALIEAEVDIIKSQPAESLHGWPV